MTPLDDRLLAAHAVNDTRLLARLYAKAATASNDENACGFYLTHAYVFALEAGLEDAPSLRAKLIAMGRESPL